MWVESREMRLSGSGQSPKRMLSTTVKNDPSNSSGRREFCLLKLTCGRAEWAGEGNIMFYCKSRMTNAAAHPPVFGGGAPPQREKPQQKTETE